MAWLDHPGVIGPGHAAVRYTNPTTGGDALPTVRIEITGSAPAR
jgi:gentisate 1,2-dioxygenase